MPAIVEEHFGDRLAGAVASRSSQLVLGLDPDPMRLWPRAIELAGGDGGAAPSVRAARAVEVHCELAIEAVATQCVAVKLQAACFERLGAPGWQAMTAVTRVAREHGLVVIADAKRGDIDISAAAYAQAFLGETETPYGTVEGTAADALTVNPLLGVDSLLPFVSTARARGRGLFVLVRTSNPGAMDVQELVVGPDVPVSDRLAMIVAHLGEGGIGNSGLSDVGAVVGATAPRRLEALRAAMPHTPFLLPGVGAQGGDVANLSAAFSAGPAGALITASRGIVEAHHSAGEDPERAARDAAARLRELAWKVAS